MTDGRLAAGMSGGLTAGLAAGEDMIVGKLGVAICACRFHCVLEVEPLFGLAG